VTVTEPQQGGYLFGGSGADNGARLRDRNSGHIVMIARVDLVAAQNRALDQRAA